MKLSNDNMKSRINLNISHSFYPKQSLSYEVWCRYIAMKGRSFDDWVKELELFCYSYKGILRMDEWRVKPHYQHGTNKIIDVELWKGASDYALSFEEKAILVKIFKE